MLVHKLLLMSVCPLFMFDIFVVNPRIDVEV